MIQNMKLTNKLMTMIVAFATIIAFSACGSSDDDGGGSSSSGKFVVSATSMTFTNNGGTNTLSVQSDAQPTVTSSASWLTATIKSKGSLVYAFDITATAYAGNASDMTGYDDRTATLTVTQGSNTATVTVTQTPEYGLFVTSGKTVAMDANGGTVTIKLKSNSETYTMAFDASWITIPADTKTALKEYTHTVTVASNISSARSGKVSFTLGNITESVTINQAEGHMSSDMSHTAKELAKLMYPGWNLGNTMEGGSNANNNTDKGGLAAETSWQSTKTTQAIIDYVKAQGFKSVRIPCAWVMGHITDASNSTIDEAWMNRVQEIVDYCIKDGLYVELNDHWDGGWIENSFDDVSDATVTANSAKLKKIWTQIATRFKNYDEHLMFGGLNEPAATTQAQTNALIKYEQAFIDAVRATGGNNANRTLVVQGPSTNIDNTDNYFDITKLTDIASNRLMVEVHYYDPWYFCGLVQKDESSSYYIRAYWGSANHVSGSKLNCDYGEESYVLAQFNKMKTKFVDKGYPVLLGEYGVNWRGTSGSISKINSESINSDKHNASIKLFYKTINQYAVNCGIIPFAWDTNYTSYPSMTIFNRTNLSVFDSYMLDGVTEGVKAATWPY
jgi:endoglucanase